MATEMLRWLLMIKTDAKLADQWMERKDKDADVKDAHRSITGSLRRYREMYDWLWGLHKGCPPLERMMNAPFDSVCSDGAYRHLGKKYGVNGRVNSLNPCVVTGEPTSQLLVIESKKEQVFYPIYSGGFLFFEAVAIVLKQGFYFDQMIERIGPVGEYTNDITLAQAAAKVKWETEELESLSNAWEFLQMMRQQS
jgi:hypothetical protein